MEHTRSTQWVDLVHNNKNNQVTDMHKNMGESHKLNKELKKLCTKDECTLCDSTHKIVESFPQTFDGKVERVMITIDWEV